MQQEETDRFEAQDNSGRRCIIVEYTVMIPFESSPGVQSWARGGRRYVTGAGRKMNAINTVEFRDIDSNLIYKRLGSKDLL